MYEVEYEVQDDVLFVRLKGEFPMEMLKSEQNVFAPLVQACAAHGRWKVLVDATELVVKLGTFELYRAAADLGTIGSQPLRFALVTTAEQVDSLFETTARNRGVEVRVLTSVDDAREWLAKYGASPEAPPDAPDGTNGAAKA